jgi:hypothetical protein
MLDACMIHMMPYLHNLFGTIVKAKEGKGKRERERERERERKREMAEAIALRTYWTKELDDPPNYSDWKVAFCSKR